MSTTELERVLRPSAVIPERAMRDVLSWLRLQDVTAGGRWSVGVGSVQRYSGPFDGDFGLRGSAVLLGSLHTTWDAYEATIYRVSITEEGARRGFTVEGLCDEVLAAADLTLASCPRADLSPVLPDPFRRLPAPRLG